MAEARETFENPRVRLLLLARGDTFAGAVTRETSPTTWPATSGSGSSRRARSWRVAPGGAGRRAIALLDAEESDRLPVVAGDGKLVGLVCFNRRQGHFCIDA